MITPTLNNDARKYMEEMMNTFKLTEENKRNYNTIVDNNVLKIREYIKDKDDNKLNTYYVDPDRKIEEGEFRLTLDGNFFLK